MKSRQCSVCLNSLGNEVHEAIEMMFGTRDCFAYQKCASCGCLELLNPPSDLGKYYPADYYAITGTAAGLWLRFFLSPYMTRNWQGQKTLIGRFLCRDRYMPPVLPWLDHVGVRPGADLLDVGSGDGRLLFFLREFGFTQLIGVDPFLQAETRFPGGIRVLRRTLDQVDRQFDYIVLNHSFEHMSEPLSVFKELRRIMLPQARAIVSTPIASSFAWREYGINWVSLDPPRHLFVHTQKSIEILADMAGLHIARVVFDSTDFQFWGSEQYRVGIPLRSQRSYAISPRDSIFTKEQITTFRERARQLNTVDDGDWASFYLERRESAA